MWLQRALVGLRKALSEFCFLVEIVYMNVPVDILEDTLFKEYPEAFEKLLIDHTTGRNIFWATHDYEEKGNGFQYKDEIKPENITGENGQIIKPRALKHRDIQQQRSKDMAEVFTPSWVCNAQNNLIDEAWFGRKDVFNREYIDENNIHQWETVKEHISFEETPDGKTWKDYVSDTRLEITCGEAPYLCSRYDTTTGEFIPIEERIGLIDRKLRIISENCDDSGEWLKLAQKAYKSTYGYEWQGDNLLIARESLLCTFIEYYFKKFGRKPRKDSVEYMAYIISWNLWQMDGLKLVVPDSCDEQFETSIFGDKIRKPCPACDKGEIRGHIGTICMVRDWSKSRDKQKVPFITLLNHN